MVPRARVAPALITRHLAAAALLLGAAAVAHAGALFGRFCDVPQNLGAADHDRLLRFAAVAKQELEGSGARAAIVARSGLALERFGVRYSHAGLSLKASANGAWSVRQLYFSCDERRPRIYDQGMAGFVFGSADAQLGYLSIITLPADDEARLEAAALDRELALALLGPDYSANAYAFGLVYQNCNQWLAELIAAAWAPLARDGPPLRAEAQRWLAEHGYTPTPIELGSRWLMAAVGFVPWLRVDDHPEEDLQALRFRISLPASIEAFVRDRVPGAQRIELCHDERQVVIRRGWQPLAEGCRPEAGDRVVAFD